MKKTSKEFSTKLQRLRQYLKARKLKGLLLSTRSNFSWLTCGKTNHIRTDVEKGAASLWVTSKSIELWCSNIEEKRFKEEETVDLPLGYRVSDWYQNNIKGTGEPRVRPGSGDVKHRPYGFSKIGSDDGADGTVNVKDEIAALRFSLTPEEMVRYREVGKKSGEVMALVGKKVRRGWTEKQLSRELSSELIKRDLEPSVILIGADERLRRYRHPLPTNHKINQVVMMVVCAKAYGLIVSLTRLVHFGPLSLDTQMRHKACLAVECAMWGKSKVGVPAEDVFQTAVSEYANQGFPGEWKKHHQGGPAGYETRDYIAVPGEKRKLVLNQALAWNPSITGTKSEDTILLTTKGLEVLTPTPGWPMLKFRYGDKVYLRPNILEKR